MVKGQAQLNLDTKVMASNLSDANNFSCEKEKVWPRFEHMTFELKIGYACPRPQIHEKCL